MVSDEDEPMHGTVDDGNAVGYGKPPTRTQFKKGQSGNRKGRPKGSLNLSTYIEKEMNEKVTVNENGVRRRIPKKHAVAKQLVNKAAGGDPKAIPLLLNEERHREGTAGTIPGGSQTLPEEDRRVMENLLQRIRQTQPILEQVPSETAVHPVEETQDPNEGSQ